MNKYIQAVRNASFSDEEVSDLRHTYFNNLDESYYLEQKNTHIVGTLDEMYNPKRSLGYEFCFCLNAYILVVQKICRPFDHIIFTYNVYKRTFDCLRFYLHTRMHLNYSSGCDETLRSCYTNAWEHVRRMMSVDCIILRHFVGVH